MTDEKDALPSDAEHSALKPQKLKDREPSTSRPSDEIPSPEADKKVEEDPAEQPS